MSTFIEDIPTTQTVPTARWWQRFFRKIASVLNRLGPDNFVASPAFPLARRDMTYATQIHTYNQPEIMSPMPLAPLGAPGGLAVIYARTGSAGQAITLRIEYSASDGATVPAAGDIGVRCMKNTSTNVGPAAVITLAGADTASTEVDLTVDADAVFAANDVLSVELYTVGVWAYQPLNVSVQLQIKSLLVAR